jgi:hypothetical protein
MIGPAEAVAIGMALAGQVPIRPMTHDLIVNILAGLDAEVLEVGINQLTGNGIFLGYIELKTAGGVVKVDSRPSDAIAVALRVKCSIKVADAVLEKSGQPAAGVLEMLDELKRFAVGHQCDGCDRCGQRSEGRPEDSEDQEQIG